MMATALAQGPTFEVASVKPSDPTPRELININLGTIRNGELTLGNATLTDCVKFAWSLASDDQVDGPDWIKSKNVRFDIAAKADPATSHEQFLMMLRALLTERFHLETRTEQRRVPHLALAAAKNGPKMRETKRDPATVHNTYRIGTITHNQISMATLAMLLSRQLQQPVIDETGLKGVYEIELHWTPEKVLVNGERPDWGPSIFTAVQEQLGLRLDNRRDTMEILVIDHADRTPVPN